VKEKSIFTATGTSRWILF